MNNLSLSININPNIVLYKEKYYMVISNFLGYQENAGYALFILINDKVMEDDNDIQIFLHSLNGTNVDELSNILADGIEDSFLIGRDYFLSWSLWDYLMTYDNDNRFKLLSSNEDGIVFPDYLDSQFNRINREVYGDIADTNIRYFYLHNKIQEFTFTKEELNDFAATFCKIILEDTTLTNITDVNNLIYKQVLEYYANRGTDTIARMLDLIFNNSSLLNYTVPNGQCCTTTSVNTASYTVGSDGTVTLSNGSATTDLTCKEKYEKAMFLYLVNMLADPDFYCDWFYIYGYDESISIPNLPMIEKLKKLFEEFEALGYRLAWGDLTTKCGCKSSSSLAAKINSISESNYKILDDYYHVLEYAENQEICNNKNKVKVYGTAFANIFPYLYF